MTNIQKAKIQFAPLQGYTDHIYRNAHERIFGGIDTYYTPFVRLEKGDTFRNRELRDINPENNHVGNLIPQLVASTPDELKKIAELFIKNGYQKADLNMGCPFPMLARRHKGAGILSHPNEVEALMSAIKEIPELKFSVKMRLGWDSAEECMALVSILNDAPLEQIGLHARIGKQQYKGETDLSGFRNFYESCKHPLLFNGDIRTPEDLDKILSEFPLLQGVMIGRGLLANPALAIEYKAGAPLETKIKKAKMKELHDELFDHYSAHLQGDKQILEKMKPFWEYLSDDLIKRTRKKIEKANKLNVYESAVNLAFSQWGKIDLLREEEDME